VVELWLVPSWLEAQERLGKVLSLRGNYPDAEKSYEAALALAPHNAAALGGLSEILTKQGKTRQASLRIDRCTYRF
jgi:cytochrome c-type biogenesis protein CcmH/NrfG